MKFLLKFFTLLLLNFNLFSQNNWEYYEEEDKMIDKKSFYAKCISDPNFNGKRYSLNIRSTAVIGGDQSYSENYQYKNEVFLSCNDCVFDSSIFESKILDIKFDKQTPMQWEYNAAKGSYESIFFIVPNRLIKTLKKSKLVLIKVYIYGKGNEIIEFNTDGLKWEH